MYTEKKQPQVRAARWPLLLLLRLRRPMPSSLTPAWEYIPVLYPANAPIAHPPHASAHREERRRKKLTSTLRMTRGLPTPTVVFGPTAGRLLLDDRTR